MTIKLNGSSYGNLIGIEADDDKDSLSFYSRPKLGHVFCGFCCDVRRATIVVNFIAIVCVSHFMAVIAFIRSDAFKNLIPDDEVREILDDMPPPPSDAITYAVVGICCAVSALVGALMFSFSLVLINVVWMMYGVFSIVFFQKDQEMPIPDFNFAMILIRSFIVYPQIILLYELKVSKTMSKETYTKREKHSCCCVSNNN